LLWDVLTERHEITNRILRELVSSPEIFGWWHTGTPEYPALMLESLHYLKKSVSGQAWLRPWWWFDPAISGEALADAGVHLADLAIWFISPDRAVDYHSDIKLLEADRWPLVLSAEEFCEVTGLPGYPLDLKQRVVNGQLYYSGNNTLTFTLHGVHVKLSAMWEYENPSGGMDSHKMMAIGTKARIAVRSGADGTPELFATAISSKKHKDLVRLLEDRLSEMQSQFPGVLAVDLGSEVQITIPSSLRTTHESHFSTVLEEFARYFHSPRAIPPWEQPNALARYYITTKGVDMARQSRRSR
jgi:predicted dehydrogenase